MSLRGSFRSLPLSLAASLLIALAAAPDAGAQAPVPRKVPGGPFIIPGTPQLRVEAGRDIQWSIDFTNPTPTANAFTFVDAPQGNHLLPGPGGQLECEIGGPGGSQETRPWQGNLFFPDVDGDGVCEPNAQVTDAGGTPLPVTVECDDARQTLTISGINIGAFQTVNVSFRTTVATRAEVGSQVCNWGHFYSPAPPSPPAFRQDTYPYGTDNVAGCSCLTVAPASGFDAVMTKSATITAPGGRLVPGEDTSTIQYAITVTNTGGTDIAGASFLDTVGGPTRDEGRGLEWVTIDDCPAPLACAFNASMTRLQVTGINLLSADPDETVTVLATAKVTCAAATDLDDGDVCNQAFVSIPSLPGSNFPTDDPASAILGDPTCVSVVWSNLTTTQKFMEFNPADDANGNGQLDVNELVTVRVRARNTGRLTARSVVVTDDVTATTCLDPARITNVTPTPDSITAGVITWSIGDLAPLGGSRDVSFKAPLLADALCCNQAELQSAERAGCLQDPILSDDDASPQDPAVTPADPSCISPGPQPDLQIDKTVAHAPGGDTNGDGQFDLGEQVRWTVVITNNGVGTATAARFTDALEICMRNFAGIPGVTVTPPASGDTSCTQGPVPPVNPGTVCVDALGGADGLLPGESVTIEFEADIFGSILNCCNQGEVTYAETNSAKPSDDPGTPGLVDDPTCLVQPPCEPTGRLEKRVEALLDTDLDARLEVGERIEYLLTFTNVGCGDLSNIRIQDASQACLTLDPRAAVIEPAAGATNNSTATDLDVLIAGPLAPTQSVTIRMFATGAAPAANCCNQASFTAPDGTGGAITGLSDYDVTDLTPEMPTCNEWLAQDGGGGNPDIEITKTVLSSGCQDPGALVNWQISLVNNGDGAAATFTVTDAVPAGLSNVTAVPPLTYDAGTNTLSVTGGPLAGLGGRETYNFSATMPCTAGGGTVTNTASVQYTDGTGATVTRSDDDGGVTFGLPDLTTSTKTRTVNAGANGVLEPGETVDFTITVRNSGTCEARSVSVSDQFDAAFDLAAATIGQGGYLSGVDTVKWDPAVEPLLNRIGPGASVVLTITVPVAAGVVTETRVVNTATIVAQGHDLALCGGTPPSASPAAPEVCMQCAPPGGQSDLLVNTDVTTLAAAPAEMSSAVFNAPTPNATTCGETGLDTATDVVQTDVGPSLATGVVVPAAQAAGVLAFLEVSERCQSDEGGSDQPICVRKSAATGDLTVITCP